MRDARTLEPVAVVEDSDEDFVALVRALRGATSPTGIVRYADGEEAVARLTSAPSGERAGIVLLDLNLPGRPGLDVLAELRSHPATRRVPVVVVSGSEREEDVEAAYRVGANAYVAKSLDFDEMRRRLTSIIQFWNVAKLPADDD